MTTKTQASPRRARARRGEGEKLRAEIIAAAERILIRTADEEAVSIRAVADAIGVTSPSIYLHFADKNDLLFAVCERHFELLDTTLQSASARASDPVESLKLRGKAYVRFGIEHPEQYRILFMRKPAHTPENFGDERLMKTASFDHTVEAVQRCIDAGYMDGEATGIAITLWSLVHGLTSLLIAKPDFPWPPLEQLVDTVCGAPFEGLLKKPPKRSTR
jgi:AcrR family transcriptional regulator